MGIQSSQNDTSRLSVCLLGWRVAEQVCCVQVPAQPPKRRPLQSTRSWTALQLKENPSPSGSSWQVIPLPNSVLVGPSEEAIWEEGETLWEIQVQRSNLGLVRWFQCCGWRWHRLSFAGYDLTPTMRDVNKKFSVRYFLNLVLVDEEDRRYFKQQVNTSVSAKVASLGIPCPICRVIFCWPIFRRLSCGGKLRRSWGKETSTNVTSRPSPQPSQWTQSSQRCESTGMNWSQPDTLQLLTAGQPEVRRLGTSENKRTPNRRPSLHHHTLPSQLKHTRIQMQI